MQFNQLKRYEFITLLGGAMAWPLAVRAQQSGMPVVGFLLPDTLESSAPRIVEFRKALSAFGYIEGQNVAIEYRWADGRYDQLPAMAAELVRRPVVALVAATIPVAIAAKAATATIPIVFSVAADPVEVGLVASLARPGGNATGVNNFSAELGTKQLGLLREIVPTAKRIGLLVNATNPNFKLQAEGVMAAAATIGVQIDAVRASDSHEIEVAFTTLVRNRADALLVGADPLFTSRRVELAILAARHAIPAVYNLRDFAEAGGLMSYGTSLTEAYRQLGAYVGHILKGASPSELPVVQLTKFELVINLPTVRALGLSIPPGILAIADEVIE
jgi:putative tryptophan/tyrosine transport system substrate-binding protein